MCAQPQLFDWAAAQQAKQEALDRVADHADPSWIKVALTVVYDLCRYRETFTTDDVWCELERLKAPEPHEPRALGAVMMRAKRRNWCFSTGQVTGSVRKQCHGRPIMVWRAARVLPEWSPES